MLRYRTELLARRERREAGRSLSRFLQLLLEHPEKCVVEAVELAMLCGTVDADAVRGLVHQMVYGAPPPVERLDLVTRPALAVVKVAPINLHQYNDLLGRLTG